MQKWHKNLLSQLEETFDLRNEINQPYLKNYKMSELDLNIDYSARNAIHDCLDFDNQALVKKNRKTIINFVKEQRWTSTLSKQIIDGVIGRNLELSEPLTELNDYFSFQGIEKSFFQEITHKNLPVNSPDELTFKGLQGASSLYPDCDEYSENIMKT